MKTVILIVDSDPRKGVIGGIGVYTKNYVEYLTKNGYRVIVIGKKTDGEIINRFKNFAFIEGTKKSKHSNILFFYGLYEASRRLILSSDTVIHAQRPDWIIPFRKLKNKKVITLHGSHLRNVSLKKGFLMSKLYSYIERIGFRVADDVISVSEETIRYIKEIYGDCVANKIRYIPPAIDISKFKKIDSKKAKRIYGFKESDKIVLFLGRFEREKNIELLIFAINKLNVKGLFVGAGRKESELRQLVKKIGADIKFLKPVRYELLPQIFACADVLGLTSIHEGFPLVLIEAMASGVPCISTDVGDASKVVEDGVTGYIVDDLSIVEKLEIVLNNPASFEYECIAKSKRFSWENYKISY